MNKWLIFLFLIFLAILFSYKYIKLNKKTNNKTDKIVQRIQYKEDKIKKYEEEYFEKRKKAIEKINKKDEKIKNEIKEIDEKLKRYFDSKEEDLNYLSKIIYEVNFENYENKDIIKVRNLLLKYSKKKKFKKSIFLLKEKIAEINKLLKKTEMKGVE